jgi:DNA repair protein RadA/Sms
MVCSKFYPVFLMPSKKETYLCTECGEDFSKWFGKCPSCGAFNTLKVFSAPAISSEKKEFRGQDLLSKNNDLEVENPPKNKNLERIQSEISEVDRVLGGGFFPGSVVLFGGQPGIGKSTLSLQVFAQIRRGRKAFYFSGEESVEQVKDRLSRVEKNRSEGAGIFATNALEDIITTTQKHQPDFMVVDSIQMIGLSGSSFGSTTQIRENAEVLVKLAKSTNTTILLIGHVTKADELAGPKILEHLVDTVLYLEGEKNTEIRILRSPKNRFGSTLEIGVFDMKSSGLVPLENPSEYFLAERAQKASGSVITVVREGARNFCLEVQALTVKTNFGSPRRTAQGLSLQKFHLLCAVVSKFTPFKMENYDAYLNVIGGFRVGEPAADLAVIAALISSQTEREIPAHTVILGEVGLSGEIRSVSNLSARIAESEKLGFEKIIVPPLRSQKFESSKITIQPLSHITQLLKILVGK